MKKLSKYGFLDWIAYILMVLCFPLNPLVLLNVIESNPDLIKPFFYLGWIIWVFGMVLVMAPVIFFPRRGGVAKGKAFVHTTRLVDTGIYAVVRHPQYLGGILAIFFATPLLYQHWLFVVLGTPGAILVYLGARQEDKRLIEKFGDDYKDYMQSVPRMDILTGTIRLARRSPAK
ncbi:MAG TPA: isoprenylcysteine carboxylmethyltransferase family protein [Dehalococcoidia bacterium]|nr:isoprenylcysteine carboxylmethyltransferase family protein [Dehalococcoidia bacterium]